MAVVAAADNRLGRVADRHYRRAVKLIFALLSQPARSVAEIEDLARKGDFAAILDRAGVTKAEPDDWYDLVLTVIVEAASATQLADIVVEVTESHPQAVLWASRHAGQLITGVTEETRRAVRAIIARAIGEGGPPRVIAQDFADIVGLDARSAGAVVNYRRALEDALAAERPPRALQARYRLAPGRLPAGAPRTIGGQIDALVEQYRDRLLRRRGENIARTEIQRAAHQGQEIVWQETFLRRPDLRRRARRVWIATEGPRTCALCRALHGQTIGFDSEFQGPLSTRGDAEVGAVGQLPPRHRPSGVSMYGGVGVRRGGLAVWALVGTRGGRFAFVVRAGGRYERPENRTRERRWDGVADLLELLRAAPLHRIISVEPLENQRLDDRELDRLGALVIARLHLFCGLRIAALAALVVVAARGDARIAADGRGWLLPLPEPACLDRQRWRWPIGPTLVVLGPLTALEVALAGVHDPLPASGVVAEREGRSRLSDASDTLMHGCRPSNPQVCVCVCVEISSSSVRALLVIVGAGRSTGVSGRSP